MRVRYPHGIKAKENLMKQSSIILLAALVLSACATKSTSSLNSISLGMSKKEVIREVGSPATTKAADGVEFLIYNLSNKRFACAAGTAFSFGAVAVNSEYGCQGEEYFVKFVDGKTQAFGRVGDFKSSRDPTKRILFD